MAVVTLQLAESISPEEEATRRIYVRLAELGHPKKSLREWAQLWGVTPQALCRWVNRPLNCTVQTAMFYCKQLGVTLDTIYS